MSPERIVFTNVLSPIPNCDLPQNWPHRFWSYLSNGHLGAGPLTYNNLKKIHLSVFYSQIFYSLGKNSIGYSKSKHKRAYLKTGPMDFGVTSSIDSRPLPQQHIKLRKNFTRAYSFHQRFVSDSKLRLTSKLAPGILELPL